MAIGKVSQMNCPKCKSKSKVLASRAHGQSIRRSRRCLKCSERYFTIEILLENKITALDTNLSKRPEKPRKQSQSHRHKFKNTDDSQSIWEDLTNDDDIDLKDLGI